MLLHQLGAVQTPPHHLHAHGHRPLPLHPPAVRLRHHEEQPAGHLRVERRGAVRPVQRPEEQVSRGHLFIYLLVYLIGTMYIYEHCIKNTMSICQS